MSEKAPGRVLYFRKGAWKKKHLRRAERQKKKRPVPGSAAERGENGEKSATYQEEVEESILKGARKSKMEKPPSLEGVSNLTAQRKKEKIAIASSVV